MALHAGVPLKDIEFMQFHPTTLFPTGILITEGAVARRDVLDSEGERFMARYAPNAMELASRDVVSRSEQTEIDEGRGVNGSVLLDLRHLGAERILERLPGTREVTTTYLGIDPIASRSGAAGRALPHGRRRHRRRRPGPSWSACTRRARRPASRSMGRTGWAATR